MLAKPLFIFLSVLMVLFLVACTGPDGSTSTDGSTSNGDRPQPATRAQAKSDPESESESKFPALAQAEPAEQEQQAAEEPTEPDCLTNADLEDIRKEHAANPFRAAETYVGEQICLTGRITKFGKGPGWSGITAQTGGYLEWYLREPVDPGSANSGIALAMMERRKSKGWADSLRCSQRRDEIVPTEDVFIYAP